MISRKKVFTITARTEEHLQGRGGTGTTAHDALSFEVICDDQFVCANTVLRELGEYYGRILSKNTKVRFTVERVEYRHTANFEELYAANQKAHSDIWPNI